MGVHIDNDKLVIVTGPKTFYLFDFTSFSPMEFSRQSASIKV